MMVFILHLEVKEEEEEDDENLKSECYIFYSAVTEWNWLSLTTTIVGHSSK